MLLRRISVAPVGKSCHCKAPPIPRGHNIGVLRRLDSYDRRPYGLQLWRKREPIAIESSYSDVSITPYLRAPANGGSVWLHGKTPQTRSPAETWRQRLFDYPSMPHAGDSWAKHLQRLRPSVVSTGSLRLGRRIPCIRHSDRTHEPRVHH